jgi:hypothetical protein
MMALMKRLKTEKICDGTDGGRSAFALPGDGGSIVAKIVDCVFPNVNVLGEHIEVGDRCSKFQLTVVHIPSWIVV